MNKKLLYLLYITMSILLMGMVSAVTYINSCQDLNIEGETYVLSGDIAETLTGGYCFSITANDITLDGNMKKVEITDGSSVLVNANRTIITNMNITLNNPSSYIIYGIIGNTVETPIINTTIRNLIMACSGNYYDNVCNDAILIQGDPLFGGISDFTTLNNLIITNFAESLHFMSNNTNLSFININKTSSGIIFDVTSSLATIKDSLITLGYHTSPHAITGEVNIIATNTSYNTTTESISGTGTLTRKWYLDAYAQDIAWSTPIKNKLVGVSNFSTYDLAETINTDNNGRARFEKTEYVNIGGTRTYASNYSVNITTDGGWNMVPNPNPATVNMTGNQQVLFTFGNRRTIWKWCSRLDTTNIAIKSPYNKFVVYEP